MVQIFVVASHFLTGEEQAHWHWLQVWLGSQQPGWGCLQLMCLLYTSSEIHQSGWNDAQTTWQKYCFPTARACHILASTDVFHNGKCAMLRAGKAEILLWKCVCLTCWVLFIHVASPALTHMFSHCRGWRQVCEILLTALKLHALTWNQDSAYIYVCSYICSHMSFWNYSKPMKLFGLKPVSKMINSVFNSGIVDLGQQQILCHYLILSY